MIYYAKLESVSGAKIGSTLPSPYFMFLRDDDLNYYKYEMARKTLGLLCWLPVLYAYAFCPSKRIPIY